MRQRFRLKYSLQIPNNNVSCTGDASQTNKTIISIKKRLVVWRSFLWEYLHRKVLHSNLSK